MSRGFVCALVGLGVTILSWYGPWAWPAWPAFAIIQLVFGAGGFSELPYVGRAATVTLLIGINSAVWGALVYLLIWSVTRLLQRRSA